MGETMNFAFAIFKYFPFGGLQRDMLRMAVCAAGRGHRVTVFTASWKGEEPPEGIQVRILKARGWTNQEIAEHLNTSPNTIKKHISQAMKKLKVES